jgi:hypothetical protein
MSFPSFRFRHPLARTLIRSAAIGAFSTAGFFISFMSPAQPGAFLPTIGKTTLAQDANLSPQQMRSYAQSVLQIEPIRQAAYRDIKNIVGNDDVPAIACHQPNSLNGLSRQVRSIAVEYCNRSIAIVEDNGLSIEAFNNITGMVQRNPNLATQVQQEMIRLQR